MGLELKIRSLLKLNLKLFLDMNFLREGSFINVASGTQFYDGSDLSVLLPDEKAHQTLYGVSFGQVWQSPFRNFVYESGVPLDGTNITTSPYIPSGVYVQGALRTPSDPVFGHTIDYINGRIIFNTPQSPDLKVNMAYAAREVRVDFEHKFNQQYTVGAMESKYFTNPLTSQQVVYPSGAIQPFPAVFIEIDGRDMKPYELGNRSAIITETVKLHVWALDDLQRDNIVDILSSQWRKKLPVIDWNMAPLPLSGIYNTKSPEYITYQDLLRNNRITTTVGIGTPVRYMADFEDIMITNLKPIMGALEYERTMVVFKVKIYLNSPVTPLGHIWSPISTLPMLDS